MSVAIDLNSDLGEGVGTDARNLDLELLKVVSSANVACGGHAGDDESMERVCRIAAAQKVAIGAHVSYVDREGFGRKPHDVSMDDLREQLIKQINSLEHAAREAGTAVTYVKAHGELYHSSNERADTAAAIIDAILNFKEATGRSLSILALPGAEVLKQAEAAGLVGYCEAFADRSYNSDGNLVPRGHEGSVITDPTEALIRLKRLLRDSEILTSDGTLIEVKARSICVHGDTPGAVVMARRLRAAIDADRVRVSPFAPPPKQHSHHH